MDMDIKGDYYLTVETKTKYEAVNFHIKFAWWLHPSIFIKRTSYMYEGDMDINANKHERGSTWVGLDYFWRRCVICEEKDEERTELLVFQSHKLTIYARVHMIRG